MSTRRRLTLPAEQWVNMIAYFLATYKEGRQNAMQVVYHEEGTPDADAMSFGQIVHGGDWDMHPNAVANLLKYAAANSTLNVRFKKETVDLAATDLSHFPMLYLTGHYAPEFNDQEIARLKAYLSQGGVLFADACCGSPHFDAAFKALLAKLYPDKQLVPIPAGAAVYNASGLPVGAFKLKPVLAEEISPDKVQLYGIENNGAYSVIYSPYAVGCGWEGEDAPFSKGFEQDTSLLLGLNVLVYSLTH